MTLLHRFQEILDEYRQQLPEIQQRIARNTAEAERLIAQNAEDQEALASLNTDIAFLEREIATMSEHVADAPEPPTVKSSSDTRNEVDALIKARRDAERQEQAPRRRQRSKPDPVKAAKKAAKAAQPQPTPEILSTRCSTDPTHVRRRNMTEKARSGSVAKRPPLYLATADDFQDLRVTKTDVVRVDWLIDAMREAGGSMSQYAMAREIESLFDAIPSTAQAAASHLVKVMIKHRFVIWTGQKAETNTKGRADSPIWKLTEVATPDELAAAGLGTDLDNYAGTTTRWPTASSVSPGARITIDTSAYESGKKR